MERVYSEERAMEAGRHSALTLHFLWKTSSETKQQHPTESIMDAKRYSVKTNRKHKGVNSFISRQVLARLD